jgi:hypothetical protein
MVHDLRQKGILVTHAVAGRGRRNVREKEDVSKPSAIIRHKSSATGQLSQTAVWRTLYVNRQHTVHVHPIQGLHPGTNISFNISVTHGATQDCKHPSFSVQYVLYWRGCIYKKWCAQSTQLPCVDCGEFSLYSPLLNLGQISTEVWAENVHEYVPNWTVRNAQLFR